MRTRMLAVATVAAVVAGLGGAAPAQADHHFWEFMALNCKAKPNPRTGGLLISAHPVVRMGARPGRKNNLRLMKISARLIPVGTSHALENWTRGWRSNQFSVTRPDGRQYKQLGVFTDYQSNSFDWNVQVRMRWHRAVKRDWKVSKTWKFNESTCGGFIGA